MRRGLRQRAAEKTAATGHHHDHRQPTRPHRTLILAAILGSVMAHAPIAAAQPIAPRIINGTEPAEGKWPAQGFLSVRGAACGGSLVSGRWFLTARHCADSADPGDYEIRLGSVDRESDQAVKFEVDRVLPHEKYTEEPPRNDVALLHLKSAPDPPLEPLRLVPAGEPSLWAPGTIATVIGWGVERNRDNTAIRRLREATVPIVDDAKCGSLYGTSFDATTMVCAGDGAADTCKGDSGGPLMVRRHAEFVLVGVTSFGQPGRCGEQDAPGVYARVGAPALNEWIRARIPTVSIAPAPLLPRAGDTVQLTANARKPADQPDNPATAWDLDGDGSYETPGTTVSLGALPQGSYPVAVRQIYPDGDRTRSREIVIVGPPPPPPPPPPPVVGAPRDSGTASTSIGGPPPFAAKLEIARARVSRSKRRLSVLAPITGRASGEVKARFQAAGRSERFDAKIDAGKRRIRIDHSIPRSQALLGTGILTLTYDGDANTQPQEVRLRAASRKANLDATRPRLEDGRLTASGRISKRARGVVRLQVLYEPPGQSTRTLQYTARIKDGRYRFDERLPADVVAEIGKRRGVVHSYTLFTGYFPSRVRGEMRSYQVLGAR